MNLTVTTPSHREILLTRVFNAPAALVYRGLTEPEILKRWLLGPDGWEMVRAIWTRERVARTATAGATWRTERSSVSAGSCWR